jgi:hypothetical protein
MAISGEWTKKLTAATDSVHAHILYIRWVSKTAIAGDDCLVDVKEEEGGDSQIAFVANGANFIDIAWLDRKCKVELNTIDSGFLEVYVTRG